MSARDDIEAAISAVANDITANASDWSASTVAEAARAVRDLADAHRLLHPSTDTTQSGSGAYNYAG